MMGDDKLGIYAMDKQDSCWRCKKPIEHLDPTAYECPPDKQEERRASHFVCFAEGPPPEPTLSLGFGVFIMDADRASDADISMAQDMIEAMHELVRDIKHGKPRPRGMRLYTALGRKLHEQAARLGKRAK